MFSARALLVPPLVQPRSPVFPAGVITEIFTVPGPETTSLESWIFNSVLLTTVAASGVVLTRTSEAETKWLPSMVTVAPCCTCAKDKLLGVRDPMTGAGRALLQSGFNVLLHPSREAASKPRKGNVQNRESIGRRSFEMNFPSETRAVPEHRGENLLKRKAGEGPKSRCSEEGLFSADLNGEFKLEAASNAESGGPFPPRWWFWARGEIGIKTSRGRRFRPPIFLK
jgi:hypothetical protein